MWLDFEAESPELPVTYQGFGLSKSTQFAPLNMLQLNIIKANILSLVQADYNNGNPFNANFTVTFTVNMPTSGTYSTVSFITPEPGSAVLLGMGLLACTAVARRVRRR